MLILYSFKYLKYLNFNINCNCKDNNISNKNNKKAQNL